MKTMSNPLSLSRHARLCLLLFGLLTLLAKTSQAQGDKVYTTRTKRQLTVNAPNSPRVTVNAPKATADAAAKPSIDLQFSSSGQLTSTPPEIVRPGQTITASVLLDENFWSSRTNAVLGSWVKALDNLKNFGTLNKKINYGLLPTDRKRVQQEIAYKLNTYVTQTSYIGAQQKKYYLNKLKLLGIPVTKPDDTDSYTPELKDLIDPAYTIEFFYFNKNGIRLNDNGTFFCNGDNSIRQLTPCAAGAISAFYKTKVPATVPPGCYDIRYELRMSNNTVLSVMNWSNQVSYPDAFTPILTAINDAMDDQFTANFKTITSAAKKLMADPMDKTVDLTKVQPLLTAQMTTTKNILDKLNFDDPADHSRKIWIMKWLWYTAGIPKINPFDNTSPDALGKASPQDKALYQIFDNMVTKGAFKVETLPQIDTGLKNLPKIKAELDAAAAAPNDKSQQYDRLLYRGLLKVSPTDSLLYMRHLDLLNNYVIMGPHPKKEITEKNRMYIFVENKAVPLKLSVIFTTAAPATDDSYLTNTLNNSGADNAPPVVAPANTHSFAPADKAKQRQQAAQLQAAQQFIADAKKLSDEVAAIKALPKPPTFPVLYDRDQNPDLITYNLAHNYLYDAPAVATYTVNATGADGTDKAVANGAYRINKLYRFRLKAGLIYSWLKNDQYTLTSPNHYTLDDSRFGVDGTVGIQTYFVPQDIRSKSLAFRPYVYLGLSLKQVSQNFYLGAGFEPLSGIAIGVNAHIGQRQELTGSNGVPSGIQQTWGIGIAGSILIDTSLFTKLFTFSSTSKSLAGF